MQRAIGHNYKTRPKFILSVRLDNPFSSAFVPIQRGDLGFKASIFVEVVLFSDILTMT